MVGRGGNDTSFVLCFTWHARRTYLNVKCCSCCAFFMFLPTLHIRTVGSTTTPSLPENTLKKTSCGGGGNPCVVSEQLHCRRTLTLPYPKFVSLTQQTEACFGFASHCLLSFAFSFAFIFVYLCFAFCILCSYISLCSLSRKLMRMPKLSRSLTYSLTLSHSPYISLSHSQHSRLSGLPRSQLSDVPTLPTTTAMNGFHFHCAAHSPPPPPPPPSTPLLPPSHTDCDCTLHMHATLSAGFISFRFVSLRSRLCSLLSGYVLGLPRICDFQFQSEKVRCTQRLRIKARPQAKRKHTEIKLENRLIIHLVNIYIVC